MLYIYIYIYIYVNLQQQFLCNHNLLRYVQECAFLRNAANFVSGDGLVFYIRNSECTIGLERYLAHRIFVVSPEHMTQKLRFFLEISLAERFERLDLGMPAVYIYSELIHLCFFCL